MLTRLAPVSCMVALAAAVSAQPISLHPDNPHYFLWRGQPTILITSGEHYGAVLNKDFDYVKYLDALARDKLNNTRTFAGGAYVEPQGAFGIADNTLAPAPGRYLPPWARSNTPAYAGGGNKFDLDRWSDEYFNRLRDFVAQAGRRGIVVEMNLFCPFYDEAQWLLSPFHANNNVNGLGNSARTNVYTLDKHNGLLPVQERMVRKIVEELRDFENVYYEICNEPYFGGITIEWQHRIADVITEAQKNDPHPKLISQNIANNSARVENPHPAVSIFNFHYAAPPDTVAMNFHLNEVIGDNETGFRGTNDAPYRAEAWDFIIAGGGLYNNLDYSFTAGHEDGTFVYPASQPGGGNPAFRRQMRALRDFINGFNFVKMKPDNAVLQGGVPPGITARALAERGKAYAVYLRGQVVTRFSARWTGQIQPKHSGNHTFHLFSNDGARLWVGGQLVIDDWVEHSEKETTGTISLEAGKRHGIKLEYFYNGGQAAMKLWWSAAGMAKGPVPADCLWSPEGSSQGVRGEYFQGIGFDQPWRSRVDQQVNFAWGTASPFPTGSTGELVAPEIELPAGRYQAEWVDPVRGVVVLTENFGHSGGVRRLACPPFSDDIALRINESSAWWKAPRGSEEVSKEKRVPRPAYPLKVSSTGRFLVDQRNQPFLIQGDTAWSLVVGVTRARAEEYFANRREKGFNAVIVNLLEQHYGGPATQDGHHPFLVKGDFSTPNEPYFKHVDWLLRTAADYGFVVFLDPSYLGCCEDGWLAEIEANGPAKCFAFGRWLGDRYKRSNNVIWMHGGDRAPGTALDELEAMADGIHQAAPQHLQTAHIDPGTGSSSRVFHLAPWCDLNDTYTYEEVAPHCLHDFGLRPRKPFFLGESGYEGENNDGRGGDAFRVRRQAWSAMLSGAAGHFYGSAGVWQFRNDWGSSLDKPGSFQLRHLIEFLKARPWFELRPDQHRIVRTGGDGRGDEYAPAAFTDDGKLVVVYVPTPHPVTIDMGKLRGAVVVQWFDPTTGQYTRLPESPLPNKGARQFAPPARNAAQGTDFVLVLESGR